MPPEPEKPDRTGEPDSRAMHDEMDQPSVYTSWTRRVPQDEAAYKPFDGIDGNACLNCRWFVERGGLEFDCTVVESYPTPIFPMGTSNRFEAIPALPEPDPLRVVVVGTESRQTEESGTMRLFRHLLTKGRSVFGGERAVWSSSFISNLPDSSFAVISPGGEKDSDGKTTPRSLRHLPFKDGAGKVDLPHLRNALSRLPQTNISTAEKAKARRKLEAAAKTAGVGQRSFESGFRALKDADGDWWWLGITSNNIEDGHRTIFSADAHREYVAARDAGALAGEVWPWHTHGLPFAEAEGVDYVEQDGVGFLVEWGPFRRDYYDMAQRLSESGPWAMSHTFVGVPTADDDSVFGFYRIMERGPLPPDVASNPWTVFGVSKRDAKEADVRFEDGKRAALVDLFTEEAIAAVEKDAQNHAASVRELGLDTRSNGTEAKVAEGEAEASSDAPTDEGKREKPDAEAESEDSQAEGIVADLRSVITEVREVMTDHKKAIDGMRDRLDKLERSDDEKVAETIAPKSGSRFKEAYVASSDEENILKRNTREGKRLTEGADLDKKKSVLQREVDKIVGGASGRGE